MYIPTSTDEFAKPICVTFCPMTTSVAGSAIVAGSGSGSGIRDLNINVSVTGDVPSPSLLHMVHLIFSLLQCCQEMD